MRKEGMNGVGTEDLKNRQPQAGDIDSNFANTLQEIVRENNKEINKEKERLE